jgi:DNA-binding NarL/FixJ family response regulator
MATGQCTSGWTTTVQPIGDASVVLWSDDLLAPLTGSVHGQSIAASVLQRYVVKSAADSELISAIRAVFQGRLFVDARSSTTTSGATKAQPAAIQAKSQLDTLSAREKEVLVLIAQGHTNQAVADRLDLSVKTVESYRSRLMEKLGLTNRADLTRFAIEHRLLNHGPSEPLL